MSELEPIVGEDGTLWYRITIREPLHSFLLTVADPDKQFDWIDRAEFGSVAELDEYLNGHKLDS